MDLGDAQKPKQITSKMWISEANLWASDWMHCGTLTATADCNLLVVDAKAFQDHLSPYQTCQTFDYANWFVHRLNAQRREGHTDIGEYDHGMGQQLAKMFPEHWPTLSMYYDALEAKRLSRTRSRLGSA